MGSELAFRRGLLRYARNDGSMDVIARNGVRENERSDEAIPPISRSRLWPVPCSFKSPFGPGLAQQRVNRPQTGTSRPNQVFSLVTGGSYVALLAQYSLHNRDGPDARAIHMTGATLDSPAYCH